MFDFCCSENEEVGQQVISVSVAEPVLPAVVPSRAAEVVDLRSEFAPAPAVESLKSPAAAGATLAVELDRSGTVQDIGLGLDSTDEELCIIKEISEGMVMNYNKTCPAGKAIKIYDRIISFNGCLTGSLTEFTELLADLEDEETLTMEVVQPTETRVLIQKPGEFGMILNYKRASVGLLIKDICDGLLNDWNLANPDTPIQSGDLIVAVNGVTDNALSLLEQIKESSAPVLTVMRYAL
ncbi:unnamed protein product [Polarella glacialis]|uniref:PDZ domain-containing protein n=1 Tax=Polarella glacialis TaxID=89957 RepID=A0A813I5G3_POLGL|nr:unnamed protein product [Polarella glacialis]